MPHERFVPSLRPWLLVLAGACAGGGDEPAGGSGPDGGSAEDASLHRHDTFASKLTHALCQNLFECRLVYDDASQLRGGLGSTENCEQALAERVGDGTSMLFGRSVEDLTFQPEQAETCLARFPHQCFAFEAEEPEDSLRTICAEVFEGSLAHGELCGDDLECAGDSFCDYSEGLSCDRGRCAPRRAKGEACESDADCSALGVEASLCSGASAEQLTCKIVVEVTRADEGEPCGDLPAAAADERRFVLCGDGLVCQRDEDGEAARCVALVARGAACQDRQECVAGAVCLPSAPEAEDMVCAAFAIVGVGEQCTTAEAFSAQSASVCQRGLVCNAAQRCERVPPAGEGERCEQVECAEGLSCDYDFDLDQEVCVRLKALGEDCSSSSECVSGHCELVGGTGTCAADPCESD